MILAHENATIDCSLDSFTGKSIAAAASFDHGKINMKDSKMENLQGAAILSYESGEVILNNVVIENPSSAAIQLRENATFDFTDVTVNGCRDLACAILTVASGEMKKCNFINGATVGIEIENCGQLLIKDSKFCTNAVAGGSFHDNCMAVFENCEFSKNSQFEIDVSTAGSKPQFKKCTFSTASEALINVTNGAEPTFVDCTVSDGAKIGISITGSKPIFHNCDITGIAIAALSISGGATPVFERCNIHDNNNFAAQIHQQGTNVRFVDTSFINHSRSVAIIALNNAFVDCTRCKFEGTLQPHCEIRDQATVQLTSCDISSSTKGTGLQVHSTGILQLNDTNIHNQSYIFSPFLYSPSYVNPPSKSYSFPFPFFSPFKYSPSNVNTS